MNKNIQIHRFLLTLTIDDENLEYSEDWQPQLCYRDVQLFIKKLRKQNAKHTKNKIKYFAVGEYGGLTARPHYHLIIFNVHDREDIENVGPSETSTSEKMEPASTYYTLKYALKRATKNKKDR